MRKQRRGEPLTQEEREALGRWQRLSAWRKALAIGGFALGTFGLGFTLGGLVFGRWRRPERKSRRVIPVGLALGFLRGEEDGRDVLLGRVLVPDDHVDDRDEHRGDRHGQDDGEATEQDPDRSHGDQHEQR